MCTERAAIITDPGRPARFAPRSLHRRLAAAAALAAVALAGGCITQQPPQADPAALRLITLEQAIAAPYRAGNRQRDDYRHPLETLEFFGVTDDMTVVEIWPGAGWYTEILAPFLRARGHYYAAQYPNQPTSPEFQRKTVEGYEKALRAHPELFDHVTTSAIGLPNRWNPAPPGSADMVLTFRNVHNWIATGCEREMFAAFFRTLKSGGVLGVEEHRAPETFDKIDMVRTGYITQDYVVQLATDAGFKWAGWEEINANPKDTKDYPGGVWSLPPVLRMGAQDTQKYLAIGESDRMTLRFIKP